MSERLDLYHRTSVDAARAILASARFVTRENTGEAFTSNRVDGQAIGYGDAVVHVRVDEDDAQLDDEFPDGEQHYRIPPAPRRGHRRLHRRRDGAANTSRRSVTAARRHFPALP